MKLNSIYLIKKSLGLFLVNRFCFMVNVKKIVEKATKNLKSFI